MDQQHASDPAMRYPDIHAGEASFPEARGTPVLTALSEGEWLAVSTKGYSEQHYGRPRTHQVLRTSRRQNRAGGISKVSPPSPASP